MVKKTIQMSDEMNEWYKEKSKQIGIPQSSIITMALQQYIDQQQGLKSMAEIPEWFKQIKALSEDYSK